MVLSDKREVKIGLGFCISEFNIVTIRELKVVHLVHQEETNMDKIRN
jgi:hypothetical protein